LGTTNHEGPASVLARIVVKSAIVPLEIHCLRPLMMYSTDLAVVVLHRGRGGLQGAEVGASLRLGGAVGEDDTLAGDGAEPFLLLLLGGADDDGVGAEEGREDRGGQTDVLARHDLAHAVGVEGSAVHPVVGLGDEDQLNAQLLGVAHRAHDVLGATVLVVELKLQLGGEGRVNEVAERLEHEVEALQVQACAERV
jgi:hypothetical protein